VPKHIGLGPGHARLLDVSEDPLQRAQPLGKPLCGAVGGQDLAREPKDTAGIPNVVRVGDRGQWARVVRFADGRISAALGLRRAASEVVSTPASALHARRRWAAHRHHVGAVSALSSSVDRAEGGRASPPLPVRDVPVVQAMQAASAAMSTERAMLRVWTTDCRRGFHKKDSENLVQGWCARPRF